MIRSKVWFRCSALHDLVSPIIVRPATIGWDAKERKVELTIERSLTGEELVRRMKGWITVDPSQVIEVFRQYGRLKVLDDRDLVVEIEDERGFKDLRGQLRKQFGSEIDFEPYTS